MVKEGGERGTKGGVKREEGGIRVGERWRDRH